MNGDGTPVAQTSNNSAESDAETAEKREGNRLHITQATGTKSRRNGAELLGRGSPERSAPRYRSTKGGEEASESPRFTSGEARSVTWAAHHPIARYLTTETIERFWSHVSIGSPHECWLWNGGKRSDKSRYGSFKIASHVTVAASRVAHAIATGEDPGQMLVLHSCDNPPCCNPAHLWLGTNADNTADKLQKGRARTGDQRGTKNGNARLDEAKVTAIWQDIQAGKSNTAIAAKHGMTHSLISRIRLGLTWRHVTEKLGAPKPLFRRRNHHP